MSSARLKLASKIAALFLGTILLFCVALQYKPTHPYDEVLHAQAIQVCEAIGRTPPPKPFVHDGCSLFPDGDWIDVCIVHDMMYWCGGNYFNRAMADWTLGVAISQRHKWLSQVMHTGVRLGGMYWIPAPTFRFGYGWPYPQTGPKN